MKTRLALIFIVALLNLLSCSGDSTDPNTPKPVEKLSIPLQIQAKISGIGL